MQEIYCQAGSGKLGLMTEFQIKGLYLQRVGGWLVTRTVNVGPDRLTWDKNLLDPDWETVWSRHETYTSVSQGICRLSDLVIVSPIKTFDFGGWLYSEMFPHTSLGGTLTRRKKHFEIEAQDPEGVVQELNRITKPEDGSEMLLLLATVVSIFPELLDNSTARNKFVLGGQAYVLLKNQS